MLTEGSDPEHDWVEITFIEPRCLQSAGIGVPLCVKHTLHTPLWIIQHCHILVVAVVQGKHGHHASLPGASGQLRGHCHRGGVHPAETLPWPVPGSCAEAGHEPLWRDYRLWRLTLRWECMSIDSHLSTVIALTLEVQSRADLHGIIAS